MKFVPLSAKVYYGNVVDASWDTALGLRGAGVEFVLLVRKDDRIGAVLRNSVVNFITHQRVFLYVVQVFVDRDPAAADQLAVVMVPQLRYFREGVEQRRHRGVADYDALGALLVMD